MRSSTASVTWTPQNGIPIHPIFNSVSDVVDDVKIILENSISSIKLKVLNEVKKLSANDHQVTEIESIFSDESIVNPFLGLETQYKHC